MVVSENSSEYLLSHAIKHSMDRRRQRKKGWYITPVACKDHAGINLIYDRPKRVRKCPVCGNDMQLLMEVDEFEIKRIQMHSTYVYFMNKSMERSHAKT